MNSAYVCSDTRYLPKAPVSTARTSHLLPIHDCARTEIAPLKSPHCAARRAFHPSPRAITKVVHLTTRDATHINTRSHNQRTQSTYPTLPLPCHHHLYQHAHPTIAIAIAVWPPARAAFAWSLLRVCAHRCCRAARPFLACASKHRAARLTRAPPGAGCGASSPLAIQAAGRTSRLGGSQFAAVHGA